MFQAERVFSHRNAATGKVEWFFSAREGTFGPYASKEASGKILDEFVARRVASQDDGGRTDKTAAASPSQWSLEAMVCGKLPQEQVFEPKGKAKGADEN